MDNILLITVIALSLISYVRLGISLMEMTLGDAGDRTVYSLFWPIPLIGYSIGIFKLSEVSIIGRKS